MNHTTNINIHCPHTHEVKVETVGDIFTIEIKRQVQVFQVNDGSSQLTQKQKDHLEILAKSCSFKNGGIIKNSPDTNESEFSKIKEEIGRLIAQGDRKIINVLEQLGFTRKST